MLTKGLNDLKVSGLEYQHIDEFIPSPISLFQSLVSLAGPTAQAGLIHGSYVYSPNDPGVLCRTYCDTRVYSNDNFVESRLRLMCQPPDIDGIMVVSNRQKFEETFLDFAGKLKLAESLKYFFTLNVMSEDTIRSEIDHPNATAIKRILALRPLLAFGNLPLIEDLVGKAKSVLTGGDIRFQQQYDDLKCLFKKQARNGVKEFTIPRTKYEEQYPLMLDFYEGRIAKRFPRGLPRGTDKERLKTFGFQNTIKAWP